MYKRQVLDTSRLWKKVMHRLAEEYTDVELTDMLVDNCAMQIVKNPAPVSYTHLDVYKRQGDSRARNAPLEDNDAEQVKTDIQDGRDGEEQERRRCV